MDENSRSLGLKWHEFMIYFVLFAGAVLTSIEAANFFQGRIYGEMRDMVYQVFPYMRLIDVSYAVFLAVMAVYRIYTRNELAGFKKGAPKKLLKLYAAAAVAPLLYLGASVTATGTFDLLTQPDNAEVIIGRTLGNFIREVVMLLINKKYYDNRRELFVN